MPSAYMGRFALFLLCRGRAPIARPLSRFHLPLHHPHATPAAGQQLKSGWPYARLRYYNRTHNIGWMSMGLNQELPFKVGQEVESKSFAVGYRSAWFRCKIRGISFRRGEVGYKMEYYDFPDEKLTWTKVYGKSPAQRGRSRGQSNWELIVRPSFPPVYRESQLPDSYLTSDVIAVVDDTWKVGDLVDWWKDGCYWSGRIVQLIKDDKVMIKLPDPPIGEGGEAYEAFCKDLRPSLNWTPDNGWTVPLSVENGSCRCCAQLVHPHSQGIERIDLTTDLKFHGTREGKPNCFYKESSQHDVKDEPGIMARISSWKVQLNSLESIEKNFINESNSVTAVKDSPDELAEISSRKNQPNYLDSKGKIRITKSNHLTSVRYPDPIESSIMELEELANKIRWLKGLLKFGFCWSNAMKPSWKFLENRG